MATKYLRREVARACPVHQMVLDRAMDDLAEYGYFSKQDVVKESGMIAMVDSIRWDYLAEFIREDGRCELVPLAARFWKMKPTERLLFPERAIAGGHGKKTAGYALVTLDNGNLAIEQLERKRSVTNGVGQAFNKYRTELDQRNLLDEDKLRKFERF